MTDHYFKTNIAGCPCNYFKSHGAYVLPVSRKFLGIKIHDHIVKKETGTLFKIVQYFTPIKHGYRPRDIDTLNFNNGTYSNTHFLIYIFFGCLFK